MTKTDNVASQTTRRAFLQTGLACGLVPSLSGVLRAEKTRQGGSKLPQSSTGRTLVLLHLSGGNDGLNTIIPYADPLYHQLRPRLASVAGDAWCIDSRTAFHPALVGLTGLFKKGRLAVIQGVGASSPDYSHRGSCRSWGIGGVEHSLSGTAAAGAWWDRVLQEVSNESRPVVAVGGEPRAGLVSLCRLRLAGAGRSRTSRGPAEYEPGGIERTMAGVMRVLRASGSQRFVLATAGGFDTHTDQLARHDRVLHELDVALTGFHEELVSAGLADRVLVVAWSEFGRRPAENATGGTDHGYAGPVFMLGEGVRGGLYGRAVSLEEMRFGNLIPTVHLRSVYELVAAEWLGCTVDGSGPDALCRSFA